MLVLVSNVLLPTMPALINVDVEDSMALLALEDAASTMPMLPGSVVPALVVVALEAVLDTAISSAFALLVFLNIAVASPITVTKAQ